MRPILGSPLPASIVLLLLAACSEHGAGGNAVAVVVPPAQPGTSTPAVAAPTAVASAEAPAPTASAVASAPPPAPASPPAGARIYSKSRFGWIHSAPGETRGWAGYLGLGGSVALKGGSVESARIPGGRGCEAWYAVEPSGYVCAGDSATIDPKDPVVVALAANGPKTDSPLPYEYGESAGAPRYAKLPSPEDQKSAEFDLAQHLDFIAKTRAGEPADKSLAGIDLTPSEEPAPQLTPVSPLVREARTWIALGSTIAWTRSFMFGGRTFVLTHDHAIIPKDRIRPYPKSTFHGVDLGAGVELPLAFIRKKPRPRYARGADGSFSKSGAELALHSFIALTGEEIKAGSETYLTTREPGVYVLANDVTVAARSAPPPVLEKVKGGKKTWLDVSVLGGTLVAYEGDKPVFATLISPGRGGVPFPGVDPLKTASTPLGTFRVDGKFVTATMVSSSDSNLVHTEVQFVQNFHGPHALHGAYWHDAWGQPKSGGCVNLSPMDAKRVFEFTEPRLPEGWYGMRSTPEAGPATVVVVRR